MQEQVSVGYELLAAFKSEAQQLRNEIDLMMNDLMEQAETAHEDCKPEIYKDHKLLRAAISH